MDLNGRSGADSQHQFQPRSFLVIGNLGELDSPNGANKDKFRSFELFRRSLRTPEVITFDELSAGASSSWTTSKAAIDQSRSVPSSVLNDAIRQIAGPSSGPAEAN
ncbi:MAG: DUF4263 domain-containing protein [Rhizobiaceae bacterium]|nr:DUF4263 domain-containing protein [Rhizobiaceae bacterium]